MMTFEDLYDELKPRLADGPSWELEDAGLIFGLATFALRVASGRSRPHHIYGRAIDGISAARLAADMSAETVAARRGAGE